MSVRLVGHRHGSPAEGVFSGRSSMNANQDVRRMFFKEVGGSAEAALIERPARVLETGVYRGPHYYSLTPMIRIMLDLGRLENWPTNAVDGYSERLLELLP